MDVEETAEGLVARLEPGERVVEQMEELRDEYDIEGAFFLGIGAVDEAVLGHYDVEEQDYTEERFEGQFEVVNFAGNIGTDKVHAHIALGRDDFGVIGGHCSEARVSGTFEVFVMEAGVPLNHRNDPETGLDVFDL